MTQLPQLDASVDELAAATVDASALATYEDWWQSSSDEFSAHIEKIAKTAGYASLDEVKSDYALAYITQLVVAYAEKNNKEVSIEQSLQLCRRFDNWVASGEALYNRKDRYFNSKASNLHIGGVPFTAAFFFVLANYVIDVMVYFDAKEGAVN